MPRPYISFKRLISSRRRPRVCRRSAADDADLAYLALRSLDFGVAPLSGARDCPMNTRSAKLLFDLNPMETVMQTARVVSGDRIYVFAELREQCVPSSRNANADVFAFKLIWDALLKFGQHGGGSLGFWGMGHPV